MVQVLLTEPDAIDRLYPFSETHCAWELRTGLYTIQERWTAALPDVPVTVESPRSAHLAAFVEENPSTPAFRAAPTLVMGGHVLVSPAVMFQLVETAKRSETPFLVGVGGETVGAYIPEALESPADVSRYLDNYSDSPIDVIECSGHVVSRLWHILDHVQLGVQWDAQLHPQHIEKDCEVHPTAVIDESRGPVLLGHTVVIGPYAVLEGPIALGNHSVVKPHAHISSVASGPHTRLNGEVSQSVVQGYSNKQHFGYLGNSYIGCWVNLGAGTTSSNLKLTYGHVRVNMPWGREDSQRTFLGVLAGDHVKTGIGTLLASGCVLGTASTILANTDAVTSAPSFSFAGEEANLDRVVGVVRTMMARRNKTLGSANETLLRQLQS